MFDHFCPKCGSKNVAVGDRVLHCFACKWSHFNQYPCTVCGKPSTSVCGINGRKWYGCPDHSASKQAGLDIKAILKDKGKKS